MIDIKSIRRDLGFTGLTLSQKVGISTSGLSMIESGRRRPSVELAKRIAAVLGFDWTLFYDDAPAFPRPVPVPGEAATRNSGP